MIDNFMIGVSFVMLLVTMALFTFVTNYQIITGIDEIKQLMNTTSDRSDRSDVNLVAMNGSPPVTVCGIADKLVAFNDPNRVIKEYFCHDV